MSAKAIRYFLSQDVTDGSAATVSAANSGYWPSAGVVPDYAYKSLGTIWFNSPTISSTLANNIVYRFGAYDQDQTEISLFTQPIDSALFDRLKDNTTGAEETNLVIRLFKPQATNLQGSKPTNFELIQNAELRIRYLLDNNWRRLRHGTAPQIPSSGDTSLDPAFGVYITFDGYVSNPSAVECMVRYRIAYHRAVPSA